MKHILIDFSDEFSERQISVVVVTFESVEGSKIWIKETNCNFPVFIDPDRKLYALFGLSRSIYKVSKSRLNTVEARFRGKPRFIVHFLDNLFD